MAADFPRWLGPLLTSVLLILIIIFVFWYYCYWKPRKERQKREKNLEETEVERKQKGAVGCSPSRGYRDQHYDEETVCGSIFGGPYYNSAVMSYGAYCLEYCSLPMNYSQTQCIEYNDKPVFRYPADAKSCSAESRCKRAVRSKCARVKKCAKGDCVKCPSLPAIMEAGSQLSVCEEENENKPSQDREGGEAVYTCDEVGAIRVDIIAENEEPMVSSAYNVLQEAEKDSVGSGCIAKITENMTPYMYMYIKMFDTVVFVRWDQQLGKLSGDVAVKGLERSAS